MPLSDFKGIFKTSKPTVKSVRNPHGDYYEVELTVPTGVNWKPGQHALFTIAGQKMKGGNMRPLSIASTTDEGVILLGTRAQKEPSDFKKAFMSLKSGDSLDMRGPFGSFYLKDDSSPVVLFASGVGITPIRAVIEASKSQTTRPIELVFVSRDYHLYGEELEAMAAKQPNLVISLLSSAEDAQSKMKELSQSYGDKAYYYLSGSPAILKNMKALLKSQGVSKKRMVSDSFNGY